MGTVIDMIDIANYTVTERLRDGREVVIRAIRSADREHLARQLKELSSESFYRRTFSAKRELSDKELKQMTQVDFKDIVALVSVMCEDGQNRIVGGGRYLRMVGSAPRNAEVAFLVDDAHQGFGIGSRMFRHLVIIARASGIDTFEADVLPSNDGMLRLFERSGHRVIRSAGQGTVHMTIELTAAEQGGQTAAGPELPNTSGGKP
jgi:RimJ/RimL family protein N-acetyltransferase